MPVSPMTINFYSVDNEVEKTFVQTFVPWKMLKEAIRLKESIGDIDKDDMKASDVDALMDLMVKVFGGRFSREEADDKVDVIEAWSVFQTIMSIASGMNPKNPTPPEK